MLGYFAETALSGEPVPTCVRNQKASGYNCAAPVGDAGGKASRKIKKQKSLSCITFFIILKCSETYAKIC